MTRAGRLAVAIFVMQTAGSGVAVYGMPIYIDAFLAAGTVDLGSLSLAGSAFFLAGALSGPLFTRLARRLPGAVLHLTAVGGAAALVAMAAWPGPLVVVPAFAALGAVTSGGMVIIGTAMLVRAFDGRPTAGMSLATAGSSAGGILVSPVLAVLLTPPAATGRNLLFVAAAFLLVTVAAVVVAQRAAPVAVPDGPAATGPSLWRSRPLVLGLSLVTASQLGAMAYVVAVGTARGFAGASFAVLVATASAVAARAVGSPGIRLLGLRGWTMVSFGAQAVGVVLVGAAPTGWVLFVGAALIGQCLGNTILIRSQVVVELVGVEAFPRRFAQLMTCTGLGGAVGPLLLGQVLAWSGSHLLAYVTVAALNVAAIPLLLPWLRAGTPAPRCLESHIQGGG